MNESVSQLDAQQRDGHESFTLDEWMYQAPDEVAQQPDMVLDDDESSDYSPEPVTLAELIETEPGLYCSSQRRSPRHSDLALSPEPSSASTLRSSGRPRKARRIYSPPLEDTPQRGHCQSDKVQSESSEPAPLSFELRPVEPRTKLTATTDPFKLIQSVGQLLVLKDEAIAHLAADSGPVGIEAACIETASTLGVSQGESSLKTLRKYQSDLALLGISAFPIDDRKVALHVARQFDARFGHVKTLLSARFAQRPACLKRFADATAAICPPSTQADALISDLKDRITSLLKKQPKFPLRLAEPSAKKGKARGKTKSKTTSKQASSSKPATRHFTDIPGALSVFCDILAETMPKADDDAKISHFKSFDGLGKELRKLRQTWIGQ